MSLTLGTRVRIIPEIAVDLQSDTGTITRKGTGAPGWAWWVAVDGSFNQGGADGFDEVELTEI